MSPQRSAARRPHLTRSEQRFNYGLAIGTVALVVVLVLVSPTVAYDGQRAPVLVVAVLAGAFLFGLGQMVIGLSRRRAYLRGLAEGRPGQHDSV